METKKRTRQEYEYDNQEYYDTQDIARIVLDIGIPFDPRVQQGKIRVTELVDAYNKRAWAQPGWKWPGLPEYIDGICSFTSWHRGPTTFLNLGEIHNIRTICNGKGMLAVDFLESLIFAQTQGLGKKVHLFIEEHMNFTPNDSQFIKIESLTQPPTMLNFTWLDPKPFVATTFAEACKEWERLVHSNLLACRTRFRPTFANDFNFKNLLKVHKTDLRVFRVSSSDYLGIFWKTGEFHVDDLLQKLTANDISEAKKKWKSISVLHDYAFCKTLLYHFIHLDLEALTKLLKTKHRAIHFEMAFEELSYILADMDPSIINRVRSLAMARFESLTPVSVIEEAITSLNKLPAYVVVARSMVTRLKRGYIGASPLILQNMVDGARILSKALADCGALCVDTFMFLNMCKMQEKEPHALFLSISGNAHAKNYNYFCNEFQWNKGIGTALETRNPDGCLKIPSEGRRDLEEALQRRPPEEHCHPAAQGRV